MAGINFTNLDAALGAYCREHSSELLAGIFQGLQTTNHATSVLGKDEVPLLPINSTSIVQPQRRNGAWNPTDDAISVDPRILKIRPQKVDLAIIPAAFYNTYLGLNAQRGANNMEPIPFERYLMDEIIRRAAEDVETLMLHKGVYHASNTTPGSGMDGTLKLIDVAIAASTLSATTISAWSTSNAFDQVETLYNAVPDAMKSVPLKLYCSPTVKRYYETDYRNTHGALPYNNGFEKTFIDGSQCEIVALPGLAGQNTVFITPQANFFIGQDDTADMGSIEVEKEKRVLNIMMDFSIGVQFARLSQLVVGKTA